LGGDYFSSQLDPMMMSFADLFYSILLCSVSPRDFRYHFRSMWNGWMYIAVKAVTAAQLSMASGGVYSVTLDEAIEAMRLTAADMSVKYKETSLSVRFYLFFRLTFGWV